ncbi:DUF6191 domain-containing protein [Embleya sp. NPDC020886]|uniref:DUF6191 domain-containing protein n=1 Tax=Embleya sp. NPDC020886 TaxID=3363980 RepID=UPI00379F7BFA
MTALLLAPFVFAVGMRVYWWVGRKRGRTDGPQATRGMRATGTEDLQALFSPGKRLELEQRRVELVLRDEDQDGAPKRPDVDLDRGVVRIRRPDDPSA